MKSIMYRRVLCRRLQNGFAPACLAALCLLSHVLCQPSRAGGSWLINGKQVQVVEVENSSTDYNALYTDGSRTMQAPLAFDAAVSSATNGLFRAYTPWDGMYDFFVIDENLEAVKLCTRSVGFYPTSDLYIFGTTLGDDTGGGGRVDIGEMTLKGGFWMLDAVGPYDECITSRGFADNRYHQKSSITTPLKFDPSLSSSVNGLFKATVPWDAEYEFFTFNPAYETVVLSPTISSLGFEAASLIMHGYGTIQLAGESTYISFEERYFGGGGWVMPTVMDDPDAILNRSYADNRYLRQASPITEPLVFDQSLSTPTNGLLQAWFEPEGAYVDLLVLDGDEEVLRVSDNANVALQVGDMYISSSTFLNVSSGARISVEERMFEGGWMTDTVPNHNLAVVNRSYADTRYIKRSEGITTNHTFQAGDVLQIQNGIITAINP